MLCFVIDRKGPQMTSLYSGSQGKIRAFAMFSKVNNYTERIAKRRKQITSVVLDREEV